MKPVNTFLFGFLIFAVGISGLLTFLRNIEWFARNITNTWAFGAILILPIVAIIVGLFMICSQFEE